jgi:type VI secretion system secreted protein VgrG
MDIIVSATIGGKPHGLQFVSANVWQSLFTHCKIRLELGFAEADCNSVFDKAVSSWFGEKLELIVSDKMDNNISKKYIGIINNLYLQTGNLVVHAMSEDYFLGFVEKHKAFVQMSAYDVVNTVVKNKSFPNQMTGPSNGVNFQFLHQYDETDYDFLKRLARYDGCVFYHDGEKFIYEPKLSGTSNVKLGLENISEVRLNCFLGDTKFHGVPYDYQKHAESSHLVVNSGSCPAPNHPFGSKIYNKSNQIRNEPTEIYKEPIPKKNEFENFIKNQQAFYSGLHIMVTGTTNHPMVIIGRAIEAPDHPILKEKFVVVELEAEFKGNVYSATFKGAVKDSVQRKLKHDEREYMGLLQPAVVIDNKDPDNIGRVQIRYLWDTDGNAYAWARVLTAFGGSDHGTHFTPRIGDQVLVGCEHGNSSLPLVMGALYHSENKPDFKTDNGTEEVLIAKTSSGSEIRIVDKQGSEQIFITMPNGENLLRMEHNGPKIFIESSNGTVEVHAKTILLNADDKIELKADKIEISATSKAEVKGQDIEVTAGNSLSLAGTSSAELKSSTSVKVTGTQVESSATATNVIKGALVQIN